MQYLLDANVLITANSSYYEIERIPHFWDWIAKQASLNVVKLPEEMMSEVTPNKQDNLFLQWLASNKSALTLEREQVQPYLEFVLQRGYGIDDANPADEGFAFDNTNDAFLIAYALADQGGRRVVTLEGVQQTSDQLPLPRKRKIPLVCRILGVSCINTFDLIRELNFRIPLSSQQK